MSEIAVNKARCKKCGDVIESKYRHDFVTCNCKTISVDGGRDYLRRVFPDGDGSEYVEELSEYQQQV